MNASSLHEIIISDIIKRAKNAVSDGVPNVSYIRSEEEAYKLTEQISDALFTLKHFPDNSLNSWLNEITSDIFEMQETKSYIHVTPHVDLIRHACWSGVISEALIFPDQFELSRSEIISKYLEKCRSLFIAYLDSIDEKASVYDEFLLLHTVGAISSALKDSEMVNNVALRFETVLSRINFENIQSLRDLNIALFHIVHLFEILEIHSIKTADVTDRLLIILHRFAANIININGSIYSVNFGENDWKFAPSADVLLYISSKTKKANPQISRLAAWLTKQVIFDPEISGYCQAPHAFGLKYANDISDSVISEEIKIKTDYKDYNTIIIRDKLEATEMLFATPLLSCNSHFDANSFILMHSGVRLFCDPGSCCTELNEELHHNNWTLFDECKNQIKPKRSQNQFVKNIHFERNEISALITDSSHLYDHPIKAQRIFICIKPNVLIIVDSIKSTFPIFLQSNFILDNSEGMLHINKASHNKFVFRHPPVAMKFFQVMSQIEGQPTEAETSLSWGTLHERKNSVPNMPGQGRKGSAAIVNFSGTKTGTNYLNVYIAAMDSIDIIPNWHIMGNANRFEIEPPRNNQEKKSIVLNVDQNQISVYREGDGECLINNLETNPYFE